MNKRYQISDVAEILNVTKNKIRFYEKEGLIKPDRDPENNYRYFTSDEILKLQTILLYRFMNIPLKEIKVIMNKEDKKHLLNHFLKQWEIINDEIQERLLIRNSLEDIMDTFYQQPDLDSDQYLEKIKSSIQQVQQTYQAKTSWKDRWNFDDQAERYDQFVLNNPSANNFYKYYDKLLETTYLKATEGMSRDIMVLDIGVGTANLTKLFLEKDYQVVGLDQSREMLNVARQKFPALKLRLGEFLKLPFENNSFDIIVSTYALHHLNKEEKGLAIKEMLRVLRKDGRIAIGDLMFESEEKRSEIYQTLTKQQIREIEDEYYANIEHLTQIFDKYNYKLDFEKIDKLCYVIDARPE